MSAFVRLGKQVGAARAMNAATVLVAGAPTSVAVVLPVLRWTGSWCSRNCNTASDNWRHNAISASKRLQRLSAFTHHPRIPHA